MQMDSFQVAQWIYNESKFWLAFGGALWSVFKGVAWIRAIKTNDLHHIQLSLNENSDLVRGVRTELVQQTSALVTEFRELRQDIRTFYPRPRSTRKRRTV